MSKKEMRLWIIVSQGKLSSSETLDVAVKNFGSLEEFIVNESKIMELKFEPNENRFTVEEVPLK